MGGWGSECSEGTAGLVAMAAQSVEFCAWDERASSPHDLEEAEAGIEARHMDLRNTANDSDEVILYTLVLPEEEEDDEKVDEYGRSWGAKPDSTPEEGISPLGTCRKEPWAEAPETYQFYDGDMVQVAEVKKDGWMRLKDGRGWLPQKLESGSPIRATKVNL